MINPYCAPLQRIFAELTYYGLLKEEDAQCLRTDVKVESTFYVLFVGTVSLAILNTFVMKAVAQFFRDGDSASNGTTEQGPVLTDLRELAEYETSDTESSSEGIRPVPVLFTDRFRWLLRREDAMPERNKSNPVSEIHEYPVEPMEKSAPSFESDEDIESVDI